MQQPYNNYVSSEPQSQFPQQYTSAGGYGSSPNSATGHAPPAGAGYGPGGTATTVFRHGREQRCATNAYGVLINAHPAGERFNVMTQKWETWSTNTIVKLCFTYLISQKIFRSVGANVDG